MAEEVDYGLPLLTRHAHATAIRIQAEYVRSCWNAPDHVRAGHCSARYAHDQLRMNELSVIVSMWNLVDVLPEDAANDGAPVPATTA